MRYIRVATISALVGFLSCGSSAFAEEAVGWRTNGGSVYSDAKPPTEWSKEKNIVWATELPGRSNAQPVVVGDRVYVCAEPFSLLCLNKADGKILWKRNHAYRDVADEETLTKADKEVALAGKLKSRLESVTSTLEELQKKSENTQDKSEVEKIDAQVEKLFLQTLDLEEQIKKLTLAASYTLPKTQEPYNGFTTATPTSDGKYVWAVFGNRVVACYDREGKRQWVRVLPDEPQGMWGHSSSPILIDDQLIVNIDKIVAFDATTGKQNWVTKYGQSWGSAVRASIGGENIILLANGRCVRVRDGKVLARVAPLNRPSPVVDGTKAFYIGVQSSAYALPDQISEKLTLKKLWTVEPKGGEFSASPVVYKGLVYGVSTSKVLNVFEARSGKTVYVKRLNLGREPAWPSLCAAGNNIYISSRDGITLVIKAGREYEEVSRNRLEYFIATPTIAADRIYIRTSDRLYCIGKS